MNPLDPRILLQTFGEAGDRRPAVARPDGSGDWQVHDEPQGMDDVRPAIPIEMIQSPYGLRLRREPVPARQARIEPKGLACQKQERAPRKRQSRFGARSHTVRPVTPSFRGSFASRLGNSREKKATRVEPRTQPGKTRRQERQREEQTKSRHQDPGDPDGKKLVDRYRQKGSEADRYRQGGEHQCMPRSPK